MRNFEKLNKLSEFVASDKYLVWYFGETVFDVSKNGIKVAISDCGGEGVESDEFVAFNKINWSGFEIYEKLEVDFS